LIVGAAEINAPPAKPKGRAGFADKKLGQHWENRSLKSRQKKPLNFLNFTAKKQVN